ncbi:hypothetical protein FGO68_gene11604 [Halteria grandinella]|uniref:Uncharacterized protein n=1 Tax=Halteria grandinella TaxID=5974 RepID=A0A8J8P1Y4_HALGN|nr:hypothetical protein FGO68_gene11604 [Halteria grandinella]
MSIIGSKLSKYSTPSTMQLVKSRTRNVAPLNNKFYQPIAQRQQLSSTREQLPSDKLTSGVLKRGRPEANQKSFKDRQGLSLGLQIDSKCLSDNERQMQSNDQGCQTDLPELDDVLRSIDEFELRQCSDIDYE